MLFRSLVLRAYERMIRPGERLDLAEIAAATGLAPELVLVGWRAWGFPDPAPGEKRFTAADVALVGYLRGLADRVGVDLALHTARAIGTAMSRIAEAEISLIRSRVETSLQQSGASYASILRGYEVVIEHFLPATEQAMDAVHRHYLEQIARRYTEWALPPSPINVLDLVVGFADLSGSTALAQRLDLAALDRAIMRFEELTSDLIAAAGVTLVKRLGDAVMFVSPHPDTMCALALDLVAAFDAAEFAPPLRVGLAAGRVVALRGDFYGPAVHLAARIVAAASPSSALTSGDVRDRVVNGPPGTMTFRSIGARPLHGFDAPVDLFQLERARSESPSTETQRKHDGQGR